MKKILISLLIIIVIYLSLVKTIEQKENERLINSNYLVTIGRITGYTEIGISNYYLKYEYEVNGKIISNEVIPKILYKDCQHTGNCLGNFIYVKYFKENNLLSEIIYDSLPSQPR